MTSIFIVSGGTGFSGEQLLRTALAQFLLLAHRRWRERRIRVSLSGSYSNPLKLDAARRVFLQGGFVVVDVTNKPVEVSAREILEAVGH
jgi:regulator of PEP synthase PpsR (kinase-PPPase family)